MHAIRESACAYRGSAKGRSTGASRNHKKRAPELALEGILGCAICLPFPDRLRALPSTGLDPLFLRIVAGSMPTLVTLPPWQRGSSRLASCPAFL
jgi:hypothetical protein